MRSRSCCARPAGARQQRHSPARCYNVTSCARRLPTLTAPAHAPARYSLRPCSIDSSPSPSFPRHLTDHESRPMPKRPAKPTNPMRTPRPLTARQRAFAELLATWAIEGRDLNYTEAARRVGYKSSTATRVSAHHLARDPRVQVVIDAALEQARRALEHRHGVTRERTVEELAHVGFARLSDLVEWDSTRVTVKDSTTLRERA